MPWAVAYFRSHQSWSGPNSRFAQAAMTSMMAVIGRAMRLISMGLTYSPSEMAMCRIISSSMKKVFIALLSIALTGCPTPDALKSVSSKPGYGTVTGVLRDATGTVVGGVPIKAHVTPKLSGYYTMSTTEEASSVITGVTNPDGSFALTDVPPGEVNIEASQSDSQKAIKMSVVVAAGAMVDLGTFSLAQTGAISGTVSYTHLTLPTTPYV